MRDRSFCLSVTLDVCGLEVWGEHVEIMFLWKALMLAARELFDVEVPKVHSIFSCDCESSRRDFIREQFPETSIIIEDAKSFSDMQKNRWCFDVLPEHHHWHQHEAAQNEVVWLWIQLQECQQSEQEQDFFILRKHTSTSKSKQTQKQIKYTPRSENKSCVANATGSTGETFQHSFSLVDYFRPHLSVLENVPNLAQEGQLENGTLLSDLGYITTKFENAGMTCLSTILDRRRLILFV